MQCWHLLNSFTFWVERCDDAKNSRLMEAAIAIIDNVKMCICMINDSLNRTEWVHHYSKILIQHQSLTIYQTYFVTRNLFHFPSLLHVKYLTLISYTWNLTDKWGYYWWAGDHCPLWARTWCCGHRLLTTERCPRWPMCRVTPGLPRPLGPAPAPGSVMTQHWRHETLICHPHTSMWRLIYAIMPCPLTEK